MKHLDYFIENVITYEKNYNKYITVKSVHYLFCSKFKIIKYPKTNKPKQC